MAWDGEEGCTPGVEEQDEAMLGQETLIPIAATSLGFHAGGGQEFMAQSHPGREQLGLFPQQSPILPILIPGPVTKTLRSELVFFDPFFYTR